jgi:hypothetical protein
MSLSLWQTVHISSYLAVSTNRIFAIGQRKIHTAPPTAPSQCTLNCLAWSGNLRSHRPLFLWRQRWVCSHIHSLCWNVTNCLTPEQSSWNSALDHMIPARWSNCPKSDSIRRGRSENISGARYFTPRQASMAWTFAWFHCLWLFPLDAPQSESVHY